MNHSLANQTRHKLGYIPELDGVRGIAILLVMGNHLSLSRSHSLLQGGWAGVDLFFVLSGFLITTLLLQEFDNAGTISLRKFYLRRALRLGPALLAFLSVFCGLSFALYDRASAHGNCLNALIALFYISNWVRVLTDHRLGLLAHTWSLSAEEQFYLFWPIILLTLLRLSKHRRYIVTVAAAVALFSWLMDFHLATKLASGGRYYTHLCFGLDGRVGVLMMGCMLGVSMSSGTMSEKAKRSLQKCLVFMAPLSLAFLIAYAACAYRIGPSFLVGPGFFYYGFALLSLLGATLILDVLISPRSLVKRLLGMRWLVWLGSISYGLYLWHYPIFAGMEGFGYKVWTVALVGTPVTFLIVIISYYGMEKPILEWKKRFSSSNELQPNASPQATATAPSVLTGG